MSLNNPAFIFDLDGTVYRGKNVIPGAIEYIQDLYDKGIPYTFFTNRSVRTPTQVFSQLAEYGLPGSPDDILTASLATADYVQSSRVFMIGDNGLRDALLKTNVTLTNEKPDYVVVGYDKDFNQQKLTQAIQMIDDGAILIATNQDTHMIENGKRVPANGSIIAAIETAACINNTYVCGKPNPMVVNYARKRMKLKNEQLVIVGDNLKTDIACGINAGIATILMLTGVTTPGIAATSTIKANYQIHTYTELRERIFNPK